LIGFAQDPANILLDGFPVWKKNGFW